ncbi:MAG TPA: pilus assembly protein PilM [Thermoclostridium caenicola]|uniref:Type IV pilus assembly protein PilM n=1 Tax=Thermoclostridium caenicola TaxID=659425 RepID=A0A1M6GLF0_9FIRM|nr:pilus assembly protein PilM [Thermoclostridium caenicola]SHJ10764.1 type IV pilus assembly protein PilM [Thermoclostridium caenicola]HOK42327.1 pilus assembly protein PilM [Thermoclostridium caenicola]HOL84601.1 pilus assembly protein PilM [Thermoclostridium caenicola]HOP72873.1 pilus assembly protein PilM [Thermoclostridium caenicola]HPO76826.1 pilus assembly protein PilM [Thermoclostridium caenicola]
MGLFDKRIIGLELDSKEIRAVEITGSVRQPMITAWGRISLPEGTVKDGRIVNAESLSSYLERLITQNGFKSRDVLLGVANQDVIIRFASFPKVPEDKIRNMVMFQAQEYIPVPLEELQLDYIVAGEKQNEEGHFLNIILVGARQKMLNDFIQALSGARLNVREIDSVTLAIGRAAITSVNESVFAVAGFNHDIANLMIFNKGLLAMARSVPFSQTSAWKNGSEEPESSGDMADILISELRSCMSYYRMQSEDAIEGIYLIGLPNINNIAGKFKDAGYEAKIAQPYKDIPWKNSGLANFNTNDYSAAISLAIRGLEG